MLSFSCPEAWVLKGHSACVSERERWGNELTPYERIEFTGLRPENQVFESVKKWVKSDTHSHGNCFSFIVN